MDEAIDISVYIDRTGNTGLFNASDFKIKVCVVSHEIKCTNITEVNHTI